MAKLKKSGTSPAEPDDDDDEVEPAPGSGHSKEFLVAIIAECGVEINDTMAAEKTSVDKARHAAKLPKQTAEREEFQVQLRNLQSPKARNQSIAARISRIEQEIDKHRKLHKETWIAIDECRDQIVAYEEEAETLRQKIVDGVAKLTQSYAGQKLVLATIEGGEKEASASPAPADLPVGIESMQTPTQASSAVLKTGSSHKK